MLSKLSRPAVNPSRALSSSALRSVLLPRARHDQRRAASTAGLTAVNRVCSDMISDMQQAGTFKEERVITSKQSPSIGVQASKKGALNFCANNYLGLCDNAEVMEAAKQAIDKWGYGMASVRFICGTQLVHKQLEERLAKFHGMEDAILFPSGRLATRLFLLEKVVGCFVGEGTMLLLRHIVRGPLHLQSEY